MNHTAIVDKVNRMEQKQFMLVDQLRNHGAQIQQIKTSLQSSIVAPEINKSQTTQQIRNATKQLPEKEDRVSKPSKPKKVSPQSNKTNNIAEQQTESSDSNRKNAISQASPPAKPTPRKTRDFHKMEQDFGKVWFVRIGIISLLTGLVFLSNHAYHNYITEWGAGPRLAGMYFLAMLLGGIGTYFEKARAALSNYGRVLAAGGLATFYYTSYAAHHVERLQVIDSPLHGGILLTMSAAACLIYALWKKSNITAILSIILAFYSTSINPIGPFSLISNLLLTLTGLILLHKLRSATIGFVSMLGAYLSLVYWQGFVNHGTASYEHTAWFIGAYWLLSAMSTWVPRNSDSPLFSKKQLLTFSSINNGFLVLLMSIQLTDMNWVDPLWPVSTIIGSSFLLIGLGLKYGEKLTSSKKLTFVFKQIPFQHSLVSLYLMKGVALLTLSLCLFFTGPSLAISLSIQATLVLGAAICSEQSDKQRLSYASGIIFLLGFIIYLNNSEALPFEHISVIQHLILAALYLGYALAWEFSSLVSRPYKFIVAAIPTAFSILAIVHSIHIADISLWIKILILLGSNLALTIYYYLPKKKTILPSFCLGSHFFSLVAAGIFISNIYSFHPTQNFIITVLTFILAALNTAVYIRKGHPHGQYTAYLTAATFLLITYFLSTNNHNLILLGTSVIPIIYHSVYQKLIKNNLLFIVALGFFIYPLVWCFYGESFNPNMRKISPYVQLSVLAIPYIHLMLIKAQLLKPLNHVASIFTISAAMMLSLWLINYIPAWELSLAIVAAIYYLWDREGNKVLTFISIAFYTVSIICVSNNLNFETDTLSIYTVCLVPLACYMARRYIIKPEINDMTTQKISYYNASLKTLAISSSLILWAVCSLHLTEIYDQAALSTIWALVGIVILGIGFASRDITFRTMAFIILGCTVVRVYGLDVWKLGSLLRILSFITLGIVLLVIGYFYSKKADNNEHV